MKNHIHNRQAAAAEPAPQHKAQHFQQRETEQRREQRAIGDQDLQAHARTTSANPAMVLSQPEQPDAQPCRS